MANLSDAGGTMTINFDSERCLESLVRVFNIASHWEYGIFTGEKIDDFGRLDEFTVTSNFAAVGRWSFQSSLQSLFEDVELNGLFEDDRKVLEGSDFEIKFDYTDYEPGCELFYEATDKLVHKAGTPLIETLFFNLEYSDIDMSWGNRLRKEVEDEDYLVNEILWDMEPEDVYEFLENERASLEEYFGKSLEDHANKYKKSYESYDCSNDWLDILKKYETGKAEAEGE